MQIACGYPHKSSAFNNFLSQVDSEGKFNLIIRKKRTPEEHISIKETVGLEIQEILFTN